MVIRKLRKKKIVNTKVISLFILLCVGTYFLIRVLTSVVDRLNQTPQENLLYTLGATLEFNGKLVADNNFPHYTHAIVDSENNKIGLKSSTINLNAYVGQELHVVGMVRRYYKLTPILEVSTLKIPSQGLILRDNKYFFVNDLMYFDFSSQAQLSANKSGSEILVYFDDMPVVSVESFACSKILRTRDCTSLITNYIHSHKDTFQSSWGYTFYKHDTGDWTTFDTSNFGFLFKNVVEDVMLDISTMFRMVNKKFVLDNKMELVQEYCQDAFDTLASVDIMESEFSYSEPYLITLDLVGIDTKKQSATCKITFEVWNDWAVYDAIYK